MPQTPSGTTPGTTDNTEERPVRKEDDRNGTTDETPRYTIPNKYRGISTAIRAVINKKRQADDHAQKLKLHKNAGTVPKGLISGPSVPNPSANLIIS